MCGLYFLTNCRSFFPSLFQGAVDQKSFLAITGSHLAFLSSCIHLLIGIFTVSTSCFSKSTKTPSMSKYILGKFFIVFSFQSYYIITYLAYMASEKSTKLSQLKC